MTIIRIMGAVAALMLSVAGVALAEPAAGGALLATEGLAGLSIAIAAFGGALSQGKVISSALESIGRNPGAAASMNQPWFLALVFIESLVLFTLVVATKLAGIW